MQAIEAGNLDATHFDGLCGDTEARIKHRWSDSYFLIRRESGNYLGESVVGDGPIWPYQPCSWQTLMRQFETWVYEVKRDLETPDLWAELQSRAKLLEIDSGDLAGNTPFTLNEQAEIRRRLRQAVSNIEREYSLSATQKRTLNEKLDYLTDAASRLGRVDWREVFIGTAFTFVLSTAFPPDSARHIFFTLLRAIGHRYGFPELGG